MTFTKFVPLPPLDEFYTPLSSPKHLSAAMEDQHDVDDDEKSDRRISTSRPSFSAPSWLRLNINATGKSSRRRLEEEEQMVDPFTIPTGYKWISNSDKSGNCTIKRPIKSIESYFRY